MIKVEVVAGLSFYALRPQPTAAPGSSKPSQLAFNSKLLLYGVTKGVNAKNDRAIVGLINDPARQTWFDN
jgi:hypothetical protein